MADLTMSDPTALPNQEVGDLLMDIGAIFYSLEVVTDFTPLLSALHEATKRLERLQSKRSTKDAMVAQGRQASHQKGPVR